jgi:hypothetical protein
MKGTPALLFVLRHMRDPEMAQRNLPWSQVTKCRVPIIGRGCSPEYAILAAPAHTELIGVYNETLTS